MHTQQMVHLVPSDQVHLIHAEGEEVASYPGHMGGELGSIATAKKEADCFSVAVLTQLQYSFVIAYPECNIHLLLHASARKGVELNQYSGVIGLNLGNTHVHAVGLESGDTYYSHVIGCLCSLTL